MAEMYIAAVHLAPEGTGVEHIAGVIWVNSKFESGKVATATVVKRINEHDNVRVSRGDKVVAVQVAQGKNGPYIHTTPDETKKDNLLSLPRY